MKQIGIFEAKTHLSEIIMEVSLGAEFTITRHGEKIAMLIPFSGHEKYSTIKGSIRAIKNLRKGLSLGKNLSIKKMRSEGRK